MRYVVIAGTIFHLAGCLATTEPGEQASGALGARSAPSPDDAPGAPARVPIPGAGQSGADLALPGGALTCLLDINTGEPAAALEHVLEVVDGADAVHVRVTFHPGFVDNTYGDTAVGWADTRKGKHTFRDLVGSDHAQLVFTDGAGGRALELKLDYIGEDAAAPSGYATLGVRGGDGRVIAGDLTHVLAVSTSLDRNLNERGYGSFTVNSPATDASYAPSAEAPAWDFRMVYEVWVSAEAFGPAGFGNVTMTSVHASPSKGPDNTVIVVPGDCPSDGCYAEVCMPLGDDPPPGACGGEVCGEDQADDPAGDATCTDAADCVNGLCIEGRCQVIG